MGTVSERRVHIPGLGKVAFPLSMNAEEIREAAELLHQWGAAIRLGLALDHFDGCKSAQDETYQRIEFLRNAKTVPEDERTRLEKRIAAYSNKLARKFAFRTDL